MAQVDLRRADIYLKDGYTASGVINQAGGYPAGVSSMNISGLTMAIPNGSTFTIAGSAQVYTVSSTVGGATPTSVSFTPNLAANAANSAALTFTVTGLAVNNTGGYAAAATTMSVSGLSVSIANGTTFTVAGTTGTYTVSSSVGGSTPTSITFTPGLAGSVANNAAITLAPQGGVVNNPAGSVPIGATTIPVSGFTKAIVNGDRFTVAGNTGTLTVTSTVGGSTPTSITFTPALTSSVANNAVVALTANLLAIKIGEGTLTFSEKRNMEYVRNKRSISQGFVRTGDDEPMDVAFDFIWEFLSSNSNDPTPTVEEALVQTGNAANWVTSGADPCEPYAVDIEVVYTPPCIGVNAEVILLKEFRYEELAHDLKEGKVSVKGKCKLLQAVTSRVPQPVTP